LWPLLKGGRCSEVALCYKTEKNRMGLQNRGRCREVVVNSGLTVTAYIDSQVQK